MRPLLIAQKMTEIDDRFVLNSILPASPAAKAPRFGVLSRFLSSGVGAAVISGAVAVGVLVAIVLAGRNTPALPPVTTDDPPPVTESTEEESGSETEEVTEDTVIDTPEEAEARKDELIAILDGLDYKWNILNDSSYYFDQYAPVKEFGKYGVPYMLDYIMEREGETDAEELKRLGVILHFAYHNLGITDTDDWFKKESFLKDDVFLNTGYLMEQIEENGFPSPNDPTETESETIGDLPPGEPSKELTPEELKETVYALLDDVYEKGDWVSDNILGAFYPFPASKWAPKAYARISVYGIASVPFILEYIIDHDDIYRNAELFTDEEAYYLRVLMSVSYEMLNVPGQYDFHWINHDDRYSIYTTPLAQYLLDHIRQYGLHPLYPFHSAEEAAVLQENIHRELRLSYFDWEMEYDLAVYQSFASYITVFGEYAVPYVLDYILSHEGQPLTPDEELNLGVLLHLCYRMLDVETTAEWHMPAEPVGSTTDPFPYARELAAHLGEYGLGPIE